MSENLLTVEEVLLLENLMYLSSTPPFTGITGQEGKTVADIINDIDFSAVKSDLNYTTFTTGDEWVNLLNAVKSDERLMNMSIAASHKDQSDGVSVVFIDSTSNEAVVAFRGTGEYEWKDNIDGGGITGAADGVSTGQQENALAWYQDVYQELGLDDYSVTITGHSKGGNKAKYITVMDDSVDRCISFDGQGFSDEFMETYMDRIVERQGCIENHNIDYDYVNFFLNDIGNKTFYKGYDYGGGRFAENHCPNTFFEFDSEGNVSMHINENGQAKEIQALDDFLNSYVRSMSPEDKAAALEVLGPLVEGAFAGEDADFFLNLILDGDNEESIAYLIAYFVEYEQANPDLANGIRGILSEFGMDEFLRYVDISDAVLNWEYFDELVGVIGYLGDSFAGDFRNHWIMTLLRKYLRDNVGIDLSHDELVQLLGMIRIIDKDMGSITIQPNSGGDIRFPRILVYTGQMQQLASAMEQFTQRLNRSMDTKIELGDGFISEQIERVLSIRIKEVKNELTEEAEKMKSLMNTLNHASELYTLTEGRIANGI